MTEAKIASLQHSSRLAFSWDPQGYDGRAHYGAVLTAVVPAIGILAVAATLLLSIL